MARTKKNYNGSSRRQSLKIMANKPDTLILLPNQLFSIPVLDSLLGGKDKLKAVQVVLCEHTLYYHRPDAGGVQFSQVKLVYHHATVRAYMDYLQKHGVQARLIPVDDFTKFQDHIDIANKSSVIYIDPVDTRLSAEFKTAFGKTAATQLDTPLFMLTNADLASFGKDGDKAKHLTHAAFYAWHRDRLGLLAGSRTYDTENRNRMPADLHVPPLPNPSSDSKKYIQAAVDYVRRHPKWSKHPGGDHLDNQIFPLTHDGARAWLDRFLADRFAQFGKYQDSIAVGEDGQPRNFLFHSCISPMLNIGLLTPKEVVDRVQEYKKNHRNIPMAAYEGFIRQVIGWREYQRYIYVKIGDRIRGMNHFGNQRKLTTAWYDGTTGIRPVDDAIKMGFRDGYLHHILRLMVVGNFMNLVGIHPDEAYKWFMEFALDAYDWVMVGNVYSMAMWADAGMTMRKPYISSSKYILDMSNYPGGGEPWTEKWDAVFHHFIDRNSSKLLKTYYAGIVRALLRKKNTKEVQEELALARKVISQISA